MTLVSTRCSCDTKCHLASLKSIQCRAVSVKQLNVFFYQCNRSIMLHRITSSHHQNLLLLHIFFTSSSHLLIPLTTVVFDSFSQTRSKSAIIADSTILYHKSNLCTFKYRFTYCLRPMNSHVSRPLFSNAMSAGLVLYICTSLERTPVHSSCSSFPLHIASHPKKTHAPRRHLISHLLCGHDKVLRAPRIVRVDTRLFVAYIVRVVLS